MGFKDLISGLFQKSELQNNSSDNGLKSMLAKWVDEIEKYTQPTTEIMALNFGLFESDKGVMIYLTGSKVYDALNDDWATEIDYEPKAKYKYLLLKNSEIANLKWTKVFEIVVKTLTELVNECSTYDLFRNRIITTGFDDGDIVVIQTL